MLAPAQIIVRYGSSVQLLFAIFGALPKLAVAQETFTLPSAQTAGERGHLRSSSRNGDVLLSAKKGCTKCT